MKNMTSDAMNAHKSMAMGKMPKMGKGAGKATMHPDRESRADVRSERGMTKAEQREMRGPKKPGGRKGR